MNDGYNLYCDFDIEKHAKTFVNYLEVIIHPNGQIVYAVPSHQQYLINWGAKLHGLSIDEFEDLCPPEYYFNYIDWLLLQTGCVSVWSHGYRAIEITSKQRIALQRLILAGLMQPNELR